VVEIGPDATDIAKQVEKAVSTGERVAVLASGDPGFFGIVRALTGHLDRRYLTIHPAPSSVSLAFARLGLNWDDALVVSAHGRPLAEAVSLAATSKKVAMLTSPEHPPEAIGAALLAAGARFEMVAVCSRLGSSTESVTETNLDRLAAGSFDPLSVVVMAAPGTSGTSSERSLAWGLPDHAFAHRAGMVTKAEVRATALGKLALPQSGVLWDVGAGSGSVAIECARLSPDLEVHAIEERPEDVARIRTNALTHEVVVHISEGRAPDVLDSLPDPDRVFVGGGGIPVLTAVLGRLRPGGRVVATFAALDRAALAAELLGNLVQVSVDRGSRLPDGGWRLAAENPVFLAWGPDPEDRGALS
jgi:precorrin-6Y C5,15-methyltransferase (decarboxylating)